MTAIASVAGRRFSRRPNAAAVVVPPLSPRLQVARAALVAVLVLSASLLAELLVLSSLQQRAAQQRSYDRFRAELAEGTAPLGSVGADGRAIAPGSPVAYLEIPSIGVRQVVLEGTAAATLFEGPGHRRDTPLPGQSGTSLVFGRRASFGGPFARIGDLESGSHIRVTTGQGTFDYDVIGRRDEGEPAPSPPDAGEGRLVLATASGRPFMPDGVVRIDAELVVDGAASSSRPLPARDVGPAEQLMASDTSTLWTLALWMQLLCAVSVVAVWAWHRWGRAQAWVVLLPPLVLVAHVTAGEAARLLPNLL